MADARPVLVTVDDEPTVLAAIARDLRSRYGKDYRIVRATSGAEALEALGELRRRGASVALLLSDQRMPVMDGTTFLRNAAELFPQAKKVLLTAYADTEVAIAGINDIGLDHYVLKPWDPPESTLYPLLDDLLEDYLANAPAPFDGIRVAGTSWSPASHAVKDFLARNRVPYRFLDVDTDAEAQALVTELAGAEARLPVVFFPDGSHLVAPDRAALAARAGLGTQASAKLYDLVIIGAGPAGLGAAVYGGSEGLRTLVIEREATGGQAGTSSRIENYLGFPQGLSGSDLATRATTQARRFGVEILFAEVSEVRREEPYKIVRLTDGREIACLALVVATGVQVRTLEIEGAERFTGAGLYYGAALTEAVTYKDRDVVVVGGGNSAGQGALFFARWARRVFIVVRRESLLETMSDYLVKRIDEAENVEVVPWREPVRLVGDERLSGLELKDVRSGERSTLECAAVFVFIGAAPRTEVLEGVVARGAGGYLPTGGDVPAEALRGGHRPMHLETSVPGIFAAGDVRLGSSKRVAAAVGEGAVAVSLVHQYLRRV